MVTTKLKTGDVEVLDSRNKHHRSLKYVTPPAEVSQKLLDGQRADTLRLKVPKSKPDFYFTPDGITYSPTQYGPRVVENLTENLAISTGKKSRWQNVDASGGYGQTVSDFASLNLTDVNRTSTPKYGNGLRGKLPDGTSVFIRRGSTTGPATMDIGLKDGRYIGTKIRYGE